MEPLSENKNLWNKFKTNKTIYYEDVENYIYTNEYIISINSNNYNYKGKQYNDNLCIYSFEVENYENESDYKEVFFQRYIERDLTEKSYKQYENKFINFMKTLFENSEVLVFYTLETNLENNTPAKYSEDVLFDITKIELNSNKFSAIKDWSLFKQICYIAAREIDNVCFVFPNIYAVVITSGLHGNIISDNPLDNELLKKIRQTINLSNKN